MVEHQENPEYFFLEAHRVLKPSGMLIMATPNIYSFGARKKSRSQSLIPSMKKDTSHISLLSPMVWKDMIKNIGFDIIRIGSDTLCDIPYFENIQLFIQKMVFIPVNIMMNAFFGFLNWNQGENLVLIGRKKDLHINAQS